MPQEVTNLFTKSPYMFPRSSRSTYTDFFLLPCLLSHWPVILSPDLICPPPASALWCLSSLAFLSRSPLPVTSVRPHASHLDHFSGLLTNLPPTGLCLLRSLSLIPYQTSPWQKELICNHSLLLGNRAKVSLGSRMSPSQQLPFTIL